MNTRTPWGIWWDVHKAHRGVTPADLGPDKMASKDLAKAFPDLAELELLMVAFLKDNDPLLVKNGHALRFMSAKVNAYAFRIRQGKPGATIYDKLAAGWQDVPSITPEQRTIEREKWGVKK